MKKILALILILAPLAGCVKVDVPASREQTNRALALERENKLPEAEAAFKQAIQLNRYNDTALHALARLYLNQGQPDNALPLLEKAVARAGKTGPPDPAAKAASLIILARPEDAAFVLEDALNKEPARYDLRLLLAAACFKNKQFPRAARVIQSIPATGPDGEPESPAQLAAAELGLDTPSLKALFWEVWSNYLRSLKRDEWSQEAAETVARAERYFPNLALFKAYSACLAYLHGEKDKALEALARALELDPFDMEVVREARCIYVRERRYADALSVWRRAVPQSIVLAEDNRRKPLLDILEEASRAASEKKDDPQAQFLLAMAYHHMGWLEEAIAQTKTTLALDPANKDAAQEMFALAKHQKFLDRIKAFTDYMYDSELRGASGLSANEIAAALRRIARSEGIMLPNSPGEIYSLAFYGREIHVFNYQSSALAAYFLDFGQYLHISEIHEPAFCQIMNIVAWFENTRGIDCQCVVTDEDRVRALSGYASNRPVIGGHSALSRLGFYVDFDGLRPGSRLVAAAQAAAKQPAQNGDAAGFYSAPGRDALLQRVLQGAGPSSPDAVFQKLSEAMFNDVAYHELGHVKDMDRFLPILAHIPAYFIEGFKAGLSKAAVRDRTELRAEAYSLAHSPQPHAVILGNLLRLQFDISQARYIDYLLYYMTLEVGDYSPYLSGAGRIMEFSRDYLAKARNQKVLDSETAMRLSEMPPEQLNQIGLDLLKDLGMP